MKIDVEALENMLNETSKLHPQVKDYFKEWEYLPVGNAGSWDKDEQQEAVELCEEIATKVRLGQGIPYSDDQLDDLSPKEIHYLLGMVGSPKSRLEDKSAAGKKTAILNRQKRFDFEVWMTAWLNTD